MRFRPVVAVLALAATSASAQRVSFPNFKGPGATNVRSQLIGAVCGQADCVTPTNTTTAGKPDWQKAKKESVQFFVTGTVLKTGKALRLELALFKKNGPPSTKKIFPLEKSGTLSAKNLASATQLLFNAFNAARPSPPKPSVESAPEPSEVPSVSTLEEPVDPSVGGASEESKQPEVLEPAEPKRNLPFVVVDLGADVGSRRLEYVGLETANLARYVLPLVAIPTLAVQFYPFALARTDFLAGLGVEFRMGFAPYLQSRAPTPPFGDYPTSVTRIDGSLRFNITPSASYPFMIAAYAGIRLHSFSIGTLNGERLTTLPNIRLLGMRAGLEVEVPLIVRRLALFGRFGVMPIFSSGEIISSEYFPKGNTFGFEANGGLALNLVSFLQLRMSFEYTRYNFTFTSEPTDTYVAKGAAETYLGGNASLRLSF